MWMLSDILQAVDRGDLAALVLLDLSTAFDTVDHAFLFQPASAAGLWRHSTVVISVVYVAQEATSHLPAGLRRTTNFRLGPDSLCPVYG